MFSFLTTPFLLFGATAALLPVIIHLIRRNRPEIVHFAAMRFLDATPAHLLRYQKLKHILLLLLRILALLLLGLAFARPYLAGDRVPALLGREPRAVAIIVDVSASMAAANHFSSARAAAHKIIRETITGDRIWLMAAATTTELLVESAEPARAEAALAQLVQRQTAGNLREALVVADNLLSRTPLHRRAIYLISDMQMSNIAPGTLRLSSNAECYPVAVQPEWQNVAVLDGQIVGASTNDGSNSFTAVASTGRDDFSTSLPTAYACRVRNFSDMEQLIEIRLWLGASSPVQLANQRLSLAAQTEQVVRFPTPALARASAIQRDPAVYLDLTAPVDDLSSDNRFYLIAQSAKKRRVLIVSGNSESAYFVRQALRLPGSGYQPFEATPNTLSRYRLEDFDIVLVVGVAGFNRGTATALQQFAEQGGGVVLTLGPALQSEMYNNFLATILPGKINELVRPADRDPSLSGQMLPATVSLTEIDFAHPIFKIFRDPANGDPAAVQASQYYRVEADPAAIRIAGFEDGSAALLERNVGKGKVLLWTSSLDLLGSNLPVRGLFVPLLYQWLHYVCRPAPQPTTAHVGQPLFLGETVVAGEPFTITFPNGSQQSFPSLQAPVLSETSQPGFYRLQQEGKISWHAVNVDRRESDPAAITTENLVARLMRPEEQARSSVSGIFGAPEISQREAEQRYKLWRLGLWAVLILLMGELWLANRTPR